MTSPNDKSETTKVGTPFDPAEYLDTDECRMAYLDEAMKTKDIAFILDAGVVVARSMHNVR